MSAKVIFVFCAQALLANVAFSQCIHSGGENSWGFTAPSVGVSPCGSWGANSLAYGDGFGIGSGLGVGAGIGAGYGAGIGNGFAGADLGSAGIQALSTGGGAFSVSSIGPLAPNGIAVASENVYEGSLGVIGELPFLSTAALGGVLPSGGAGVVNHGCGNGITAITSEIDNSGGVIGAAGIGSGVIGSGVLGATGFGSGVIGGTGFGSGAMGYGLGLGGMSSGITGLNCGQAAGHRCSCGLY